MSSFLLDQIKNSIVGIINIIDNDTIRNLWFYYIDYFDINAEDYNTMTFIYLIVFIASQVFIINTFLYLLLTKFVRLIFQ